MPSPTPLDLTTKTAAIIVLLLLALVVAAGAVLTAFFPQLHDISARLTNTFFELLGSILLALSISGRGTPQPPLAPAGE